MDINRTAADLELELSAALGAPPRRVWNSCCLRIDQDACTFSVTMVGIFMVMIFSCIQLIRLSDCHSQNMYVSLLSGLVGILLPSPILKSK